LGTDSHPMPNDQGEPGKRAGWPGNREGQPGKRAGWPGNREG
jgi:hypothetical protein